MSAQISLSRVAYAALVAPQGFAGTVRLNRKRIQATAVSCNMSSCELPGCTDASSPSAADINANLDVDGLSRAFKKRAQELVKRNGGRLANSTVFLCVCRSLQAQASA